jgi:hypothetical protein
MVALATWAGWLVAAALAAGLGLLVWAGAGGLYGSATMLAVGGSALLVLAWVRERRERSEVRLRHCLECGASVDEKAAVCPRCQSVRLEAPVEERALAGGPSRGRREGREMPVTAYSSDASGVIGWVDAAPPGSWSTDGMSPRHLRRWGVVLFGLAVVLAAAGAFSA